MVLLVQRDLDLRRAGGLLLNQQLADQLADVEPGDGAVRHEDALHLVGFNHRIQKQTVCGAFVPGGFAAEHFAIAVFKGKGLSIAGGRGTGQLRQARIGHQLQRAGQPKLLDVFEFDVAPGIGAIRQKQAQTISRAEAAQMPICQCAVAQLDFTFFGARMQAACRRLKKWRQRPVTPCFEQLGVGQFDIDSTHAFLSCGGFTPALIDRAKLCRNGRVRPQK